MPYYDMSRLAFYGYARLRMMEREVAASVTDWEGEWNSALQHDQDELEGGADRVSYRACLAAFLDALKMMYCQCDDPTQCLTVMMQVESLVADGGACADYQPVVDAVEVMMYDDDEGSGDHGSGNYRSGENGSGGGRFDGLRSMFRQRRRRSSRDEMMHMEDMFDADHWHYPCDNSLVQSMHFGDGDAITERMHNVENLMEVFEDDSIDIDCSADTIAVRPRNMSAATMCGDAPWMDAGDDMNDRRVCRHRLLARHMIENPSAYRRRNFDIRRWMRRGKVVC